MWTKEQDAQIIDLWNGGHSAAVIAAKLDGKSRSAVLGRLHRLRGATKRREPITLSRPREKKATPTRKPTNPVAKRPVRELQPAAAPIVVVRANEVRPDGQHTDLMCLSSAGCKWPMTVNLPFAFCNRLRHGGSSYCDEHTLKSFSPRTDGSKIAVDDRREIRALPSMRRA